jgi:ribosome biogenesis protein ENP2
MAKTIPLSVIHDFKFPAACNLLKTTDDGETIVSAGTYKPVMAIYELTQHSLKCERNCDSETKALTLLGNDWRKIALLQKNRTVEFHTRFGKHYTLPLPRQGHTMAGDLTRAEVLVGGNGELFRFNMEEGRFYSPLKNGVARIESLSLSRAHGLYALFGLGGEMEFVDPRDRSVVKSTSIPDPIMSSAFEDGGLFFSVGTASGKVFSYDIRSQSPLFVKDHMYEFPIKQVAYHGRNVLSLDKKGVKIWERGAGKTLCSIETGFDLNTFCFSEGILFVGGESQDVQTFYVPLLGIIPKWCSHLERVTEEMAEERRDLFFDKYRFVTREELGALGMEEEVGKSVRVYMHGFLVDKSLCGKRRSPETREVQSRICSGNKS